MRISNSLMYHLCDVDLLMSFVSQSMLLPYTPPYTHFFVKIGSIFSQKSVIILENVYNSDIVLPPQFCDF